MGEGAYVKRQVALTRAAGGGGQHHFRLQLASPTESHEPLLHHTAFFLLCAVNVFKLIAPAMVLPGASCM